MNYLEKKELENILEICADSDVSSNGACVVKQETLRFLIDLYMQIGGSQLFKYKNIEDPNFPKDPRSWKSSLEDPIAEPAKEHWRGARDLLGRRIPTPGAAPRKPIDD